MKFTTLIFLSSLTLLTSCGSFMDGMYQDLDRQERLSADEQEENTALSRSIRSIQKKHKKKNIFRLQ